MQIEVRFFNSMTKYVDDARPARITVEEGATLGDLLHQLGIPDSDIFILFMNGRGLLAGPRGHVALGTHLADGDRLAFSGPVPFSRAYGTPVV